MRHTVINENGRCLIFLMLAPEIGGRSGFIFPEYTGQLGGTVVAYLTGNLLDGEVCIDQQLFGSTKALLMKTEKIRLTDVFFEKGTDIIWMHFYSISQVVQRNIILVIFPDVIQKLLYLGVISGILIFRSLLEFLFDSRKILKNFFWKNRKIIFSGKDGLPAVRK